MHVALLIDGKIVFQGDWANERQAVATLLTSAQFLHNLGVTKGSQVIRDLDRQARPHLSERKVG